MDTKLAKVIKEIQHIADCFAGPEVKMDENEFGERIMAASVLATSYATTAQADDEGRVIYRRMNNLRVGVAAAAVYSLKGEQELPQNEFIDQAVKIYMAYEGIPLIDPNYMTRRLYSKAVIYSYLDRLFSLHLMSRSVSNGVRYIKLEPQISSYAYAMLMDPESTLRSPYLKAMAQTTGAMATVDKNQEKLTDREVADIVMDSLLGRVLESSKSPWRFALQNIYPLHQIRNNVPFYSQREENKLIVLPTFPEPGAILPPSKLITPLLSPDYAVEIFQPDELQKLTSGPNPALIKITSPSSGHAVYFYHHDAVIQAYAKHFGVTPSRFTPEASVAIAIFSELQSKLSYDFDPTKVSSTLGMFLEGDRVKVSELNDHVDRRIYSLLSVKNRIIEIDSGGYVKPIAGFKGLLKDVRELCNIRNVAFKSVAKVASEVG
jgi:hypothetical protein